MSTEKLIKSHILKSTTAIAFHFCKKEKKNKSNLWIVIIALLPYVSLNTKKKKN